MANYADVKAIIDTYIKRNGIKAITGNILNGVLNAMLNELGAGYQYGGMAVPATDPGAPDYNVVYLAATAGTYTDFDGITLAEGEIALLKYNGSWAKETVGSFYSRTDIDTMLEDYVQKEPGKGLSTNDYTDDDKAKLDGIEPGAQVNVIAGVSVNGTRLQPDQDKVVDVDVPTDLSELREDAEHRLVTDDDITIWDAKYDKPAGGIPAADLAQAVRDLLALADSSLQPSDIVQETGEQTDKVMSQKAVTDAIKEGAGKDGYYPGLIAGNADALMGRPSNAEILFAPYPGASGNALIQSIYGKTVVWNQLVQNGDTQVTVPSGHLYLACIGGTKSVATSDGNPIAVTGGTDWIVDLTLLTGITTVAEFEKFYNRPYYAFNAGTLLSNKTAAIESRGFNQWDEEWEVGIINNQGVPVSNPNSIRSKNFIPIFGNTTYYFQIPNKASGTYMGFIYYYDAAQNFISSQAFGPSAYTQHTTPSNARLMKFYLRQEYGTTYNHDICINISDTAKNGEYEPYTLTTLRLDLTTITGKLNGEGESVVIAPDGLRGAGTARDEGIVENGYLTRIRRYMDVVDLGTLNWAYISQAPYKWMVSDALPNAKADNSYVANFMTELRLSHYSFNALYQQYATENGIAINAAGKVIVRDSAYTDAATFKAAMSGVLHIYERTTPLEYVLDTPIPITYAVENGGTERILPDGVDEQGVPATAPFPFLRRFPIDIIDDVTKPLLDAAVTAGVIAGYTVTWDAETGQFDFTFTAASRSAGFTLGNPFAQPDTEKKGDVEATDEIDDTEAETKAELTK